MLNKILKHNLKLSVMSPIVETTKRFVLEKGQFRCDTELSSQGYETLASKTVVGNARSLADNEWMSPKPPESRVNPIFGDKTEVGDNRFSISEPFVLNQSQLSDMSSNKCEVRLLDYDGWALFWPERRKTNGTSGFHYPMNLNSKECTKHTSGVRMFINNKSESSSPSDMVFLNEVFLEVNGNEPGRGSSNKGWEKNVSSTQPQSEKDVLSHVQYGILNHTKTLRNIENPCGRALKDLEELRSAIQKAQETRVSASRELKLLQELLQGSDNEEDEMSYERTATFTSEAAPNIAVASGYQTGSTVPKALSELQGKPGNDSSQSKEFREEEIRKAKEEIRQVCDAKLNLMEQKLRTTEAELARAMDENGRLKNQLELSAALPVCECKKDARKSNFSHMNGISVDEPGITSVDAKPSIATKSFWQEWDRLQSDLMKAERKADELNMLLNQKLIELNKMQLTLSKQTKEMILLEKAYFQLRMHLSKRRVNKSAMSRQSSTLARTSTTTEGVSDSSSKVSDPDIPP